MKRPPSFCTASKYPRQASSFLCDLHYSKLLPVVSPPEAEVQSQIPNISLAFLAWTKKDIYLRVTERESWEMSRQSW